MHFIQQWTQRLQQLRVAITALRDAAYNDSRPVSIEQVQRWIDSLRDATTLLEWPDLGQGARRLHEHLNELVAQTPYKTPAQRRQDWSELLDKLNTFASAFADFAEYQPTHPNFRLPIASGRGLPGKNWGERPVIQIFSTDATDPALTPAVRSALHESGYTTQYIDLAANSADLAKLDQQPAPFARLLQTTAAHPAPKVAADILRQSRQQGITTVAYCDSEQRKHHWMLLRAGASRVLNGTVTAADYLRILDIFGGHIITQPYQVLLVVEDVLLRSVQASVLRAAGMHVTALSTPEQVLSILDYYRPDVILLDGDSEAGFGLELGVILREHYRPQRIPVICLLQTPLMTPALLSFRLTDLHILGKNAPLIHWLTTIRDCAHHAHGAWNLQRRLQDTAYKREREHRAMNAHALISASDRQGRIIYANRLFCEVSGYRPLELLGQNHRIIKSNQHPPEFFQEMWTQIARGEIWQGEICNQRKDGELYWVQTTIVPFVNERGIPYQYVAIRTNITQVKAIEASLRQQHEALAESQHWLEEAQSLAHIGHWRVDPRYDAIYWSDEVFRIFGHSPGSIQPSEQVFEQALHPEDRPIVNAYYEEVEAHGGTIDLEYRILRPDGQIRYIHELGEAGIDPETRELSIHGTVQDITERVRTEQMLIAARDEADRANQAKSEFLSSISHELRTPMNAILGFAQLIECDPEIQPVQRENAQEILRAGHHLLGLINQVLDLARVESGTIKINLEPVELDWVLDECLSLVESLAQRYNITVKADEMAPAVVYADRLRLKQAILNVLSNAIKYNRPGGEVHLRSSHSADGQRLYLHITDSGIGIPRERFADVFEPFNRLDWENSAVEGTGIGLPLTLKLLELMGGDIQMDSVVGQGSTFTLDLPIALATEALPARTIEQPLVDSLAPENLQQTHTLLYIEDNPSNMRLMAQILEKHTRLRLLTAYTAEQGLTLALTQRPQLILTDLHLPDMPGDQLLKALKSKALTRDIPVIAITADALSQVIDAEQAFGFAAALTKPIELRALMELLHHYLPSK